MRDDFACLVLCHGRPDNTPTIETLKKCHYTGKIYIVCDDEDTTVDGYRLNFGNIVELFSKDEIAKTFDVMDNKHDKRCAVYARNACFDIAKKLGLKYFCELDDDYVGFAYRYKDGKALRRIDDVYLDDVFETYIEYLETSEDIYSIAFGQPGDYVGGATSQLSRQTVVRKCMNSWICCTDRRFTFNGTMNDDVNTFTLNGARGKLFLTFSGIMIDQPETQREKGGMTDLYLDAGTYQKSFYTVMCCPSFTTIKMWGDRYYRFHHSINYDIGVPKIISDKYRRQ